MAFIPEIWSPAILENFHNQSVLSGLTRRTDFEGQVRVGNTIHLKSIVDIVVKDYKTGVVSDGATGKIPRTTEPDEVDSTQVDVVIDQEKSFDFLVDDIDKAQDPTSFEAYTASAGLGLVEDAKAFMTALLLANGTKIGSPAAVSDWASAYGAVLSVREALTAAKVPNAQRVLLINPAFERHLLSDASKLTSFDTSNTTDGLREAAIGRLLGFTVISSMWMDNAKPTAIGIHVPSVAYVSQIDKMETMRAEKKFADRIRGLHVYGGKVLRPTAVQAYVGA